ncbi:unnamed protein product [Lactuca saligna]|uniref:separase n=1 Tax=Lactuca saligna TaxID=75948 RepID=A0AA36E8I5_LACSI|nr:unnamed protein product [Lactuca saligna]
MEDSATSTEASLLSKLQSSSDLSSIHQLFSLYLHPFSAIINKPNKQSKSSKTNTETSTIIRSLAKKFLSFLSKSLSLIPKRLNETPKIDSCYASELFEAYKLCLRCLESVSSELSCKPHSVQIQRVRLIHCYENWGRYEDAQNEGFSVFEFIGKLSDKGSVKLKRGVIPELRNENCDKEVAMLILEVAVTLIKCVSNGRSKDEEDYRRLLSMVDEIQPWLRVVDVDAYEKLQKMLVTYLNKCTLFLVGELASFDGSLVHRFCVLTFSELRKSSMNDQMEKFGHRICSSVFSQLDDNFLCSVDILTCVLDAMAHEFKNGKEKSHVEFLELAEYCAIKCRNANVDFCNAVATHFDKLTTEFSQVNLSPVDLIMRLYAITLFMSDLNSYTNGGNTKISKSGKDISILNILLKVEDQLQTLTTTDGLLTQMTYVPLYFTALKFLCGPLSELIISERKDILCGLEDVSFSIKLPNIQDAFHQFGLVFLTYRASEKERDVYEDNRRTVLAVAAASFTLSFATQKNVKESTKFLKHLISADWVKVNGLQYLFATLHNVGIVLYRSNRLKEATKSFKVCCKAAWNCVLHFCKTFTSSRDGFSSDMTEDTIVGFVTEACAKSAFLLDILYQCGSNKISKIFMDFLGSWSVGQSLFDQIPTPVALIKQWVKIQCKQIKDPEAAHRIPTIYSLMSSINMSKETFGILLEQELEAYKEMKFLNPTLCKTMQMTITNILLEEIYSTKDNCLQKSRILIANARESRAHGVEGLNDCSKYLSEAISLMSDYKSKDDSGSACYVLAEAYCLHALCTQEADPNSKNFVQDVSNALKLWLSQEHFQSDEQAQNTLILLYHVADFLSLKGYMEDHSNIYETMIKIITWRNMPLNEWLTMLWQSRSLSHALCASPVNDAFIMTLSNHCNLSKSMEFWISCMKGSKSLEVGFQQSLSLIPTLSSPDSCKHNHAIQPHITTDEVKQAASDLINNVPLSTNSLFLAAHLYYDLGERMIAQGLMIEALCYAKEAHRLRTKLLQKSFMYSIEQQNDMVGANGDTIQKQKYVLKTFHMHPSVATSAWSSDKGSCDFEDCIITPWNVLRVYLESTLQIGTLQEIVGNGSEAESLLLWGKNIATFQSFPIFIVGFSCVLGKLYRKQQHWHLAEKELESAKHILADSCRLVSCLKCRLVLEVTIDQQLGDLFRIRFNSTNKLSEGLSKAEAFYRSATDKLKVSEWRNCVSDCEESSARNTMFCDALSIGENQEDKNDDSQINGKETIRPKVTRKSKKSAKPLSEKITTSRVTRSSKQKGEVTCVSDEGKCWHCLPSEIMKSKSLTSILQMKWECIRRRLLLRLLTGIGKCLGIRGEIQRAHEVFMESISVLVHRSTFHQSHFSVSIAFLAELIEKNVTGDVFAVEHASILYNICWFSLKSLSDKGTRHEGYDMLMIPITTIVSGLKLSFIMCREVPVLFQKVSRLLAMLYTLSPSNKALSMLSSSSSVLSESQWASFFHQASLGTHLNHQLVSRIGKHKDQNTTTDVHGTSLNLLRVAPESILDLEGFVLKFYKSLPCTTIICISMLGDDYTTLLRELLPYSPSTHAWIILSRLNSDTIPIITLLPINSILTESSEGNEDSSSSFLSNKKSCNKSWHCPWGHTIVDNIAPLFKTILEENYISSSVYPLEDTKKNRSLWWGQRRKLDQLLGDLLRDVEDLWFGPWKVLLLGEFSDNKHIDSVHKKLMNDLKFESKVDVHESILKVIIGGAGPHAASQHEEWVSEMMMKKGCYIGGIKCEERIDTLSSSVSELILDAIREIEEEDREPVILVLDFDIQMLPWENLPILRNQEVYRMPSVATISYTFDRSCQYQEKSAVFPMIDPLDAYYLLNPGGDLPSTQAEFQHWLKDKNLEGTTGTSPSVDELSMALKKHDLFMYFGHGSGVQYIPGDEIQKLDGCAATLLMGCSSGSLSLNGSYSPKGAPLYYLFAGSPVIVANLWEVTDKDIDRFGKAVLDAWIKTRSISSTDCAQCTEISDRLNNMNIVDDDGGDKRKGGKKKTSRKKSVNNNNNSSSCKHRPKIGSFMGQAREACTLPFLIGASPVCYGVPTGIRNKDL